MLVQDVGSVVNVSDWSSDDEFRVYPEGARDKSRLVCPSDIRYDFLIPDHYYLFKHSTDWSPEQYWIEIMSYRLGSAIGIPVPPAFVAFDADNNTSGALIEWFYGKPNTGVQRFIPGGDFMQRLIDDYDRKRGKKHNFETLLILCKALERSGDLKGDWLAYWAKALTFDALIGNADRHHDNWGVIQTISDPDSNIKGSVEFSPVFDNGSSMGFEIRSENLASFSENERMSKYVSKGFHHLKWAKNDTKKALHGEMLLNLVNKFPDSLQYIRETLDFDTDVFGGIVGELADYDVPVPLSQQRANFMINLLVFRHGRLTDLIQSI